MKKTLALLLAAMMVFALCACGGSAETPAAEPAPAAEAAPAAPAAPAGEVTWADYQQYLIDKAGANAPDLDEFKGQVYAINSWEELDQTVSPWDQMFTTIGLSTWDEFKAGNVKEPAVGGPASGEPTDEPAAEDASGEPTGDAPEGEPPASGTAENTAHGGTPGAISEADYQAYLKAWIDAEQEVNSTMTDDMKAEFYAAADAMDFSQRPGDMFFNGFLVTGTAMTFEEFVEANGVY